MKNRKMRRAQRLNMDIVSSRVTFHLKSSPREAAHRLIIFPILIWVVAFSGIALCTIVGFLAKESFAQEVEVAETPPANNNKLLWFQRKQVSCFSSNINALKGKMVYLDQFVKAVREMSDPAQGEETESLFGVGGSSPEDLEPSRSLKAGHDSLTWKMPNQPWQSDQETEIQQEDYLSLIGALAEREDLLARTPSIYPAKGRLTSVFGKRKSPFGRKSEFHKGIDIAAKRGTPVVAPADGRVMMAGYNGAYGRMLVIDHGYGVVTRYAHLKKFLKKKGDLVKRGEKIAQIGNTGRSTGPHLHYEVQLNGTPVDPQNYFMNSDEQQMVTYQK